MNVYHCYDRGICVIIFYKNIQRNMEDFIENMRTYTITYK